MLEKLSKIAHESWAGWTKYFFEKGVKNEDGTITIPKWAVERWERQIKTDYKDLPEKEKESDRTEAREYLKLSNWQGLNSELIRTINQNNRLYSEIGCRPFKIQGSCDFVRYPKSNKDADKELTDKLKKGEEFYVNAKYENAILSIRPVMEDESIFYGLVVGIENKCNISINDFVQFQTSDLYDM